MTFTRVFDAVSHCCFFRVKISFFNFFLLLLTYHHYLRVLPSPVDPGGNDVTLSSWTQPPADSLPKNVTARGCDDDVPSRIGRGS